MSDLKLAIEGTIVMSDTLRGLLDAMYDARVPEIWEKMSWQSTTLGFWYTELLERDSQFRRWCFMGRPKVNSSLSYCSYKFRRNELVPTLFGIAGILGHWIFQSSRFLNCYETRSYKKS